MRIGRIKAKSLNEESVTNETNDMTTETISNSGGGGTSSSNHSWMTPLRSARKSTTAALLHAKQAAAGKLQSNMYNSSSNNNNPSSNISSLSLNGASTVTSVPPPPSGIPPPREDEHVYSMMPAYADNFSFEPNHDFTSTSLSSNHPHYLQSSCDNFIEPPSFDTPTDLKMSSGFSQLIMNAKKVDQVHKSKMKDAKMKTRPSIEQLLSLEVTTIGREEDKNNDNNGNKDKIITVEEAQKKLIEQLKQALNFFSSENKELTAKATDLEQSLSREKQEHLMDNTRNKKEIEERNLKLAVLEQHFCALNSGMHENGDVMISDDVLQKTFESKPQDQKLESLSGMEHEENHVVVDPGSLPAHSIEDTRSSIIRLDKSYYMELEGKVKWEYSERIKSQEVNEILAARIAKMEQDALEKEAQFKEQIDKQERTIQNLELDLQQSRLTRFKSSSRKKLGHKRRTTVSGLPSIDSMIETNGEQDDDDDESASQATSQANESNRTPTEEEFKEIIDAKVSAAVSTALEEKEKEYASSIEVLNRQLDMKDKIISRMESKLLTSSKSKADISTRKGISPDVLLRNIGVTNELLNSSIQRLENMMTQMGEEEKMNNSTMDEIMPIRRLATQISLVQNELRVSLKLIEQRLVNGVESVRYKATLNATSDNDDSDSKSQQDSDANETLEDLIAQVQVSAAKAFKETEAVVKKEIDALKDSLQSFEFMMSSKQDTIEALEMACVEHVEKYRQLQEKYDKLQLTEDGEVQLQVKNDN